MASLKVAARAQSATVRSAVSPVASVAARKPRAAALRVDAFVSQPNIASKPEDAQKNFLDMAMSAVMSFFEEQPQQNASEELQLPPELKAYLEEMEAHEGGSHGGWVHSHIAERLASVSDEYTE